MNTAIDFDETKEVLEMIRDVTKDEVHCFCFHQPGIQQHSEKGMKGVLQDWTLTRQDETRIVYLLIMEDGGGVMPPPISNNNTNSGRAEVVECPTSIKAALLLVCEKFARTIFDTEKVKMVKDEDGMLCEFENVGGAAVYDIVPSAQTGNRPGCFFSMPLLTNNVKRFDRARKRAMKTMDQLVHDKNKLDVCIELRRKHDARANSCVVQMSHGEVMDIRRVVDEHRKDEREKMLAFCMIMHARLNAGCAGWARAMASEMLRIVGDKGALVWQ